MSKKSQELASEALVAKLLLGVWYHRTSLDHPAHIILNNQKLYTWVTKTYMTKNARAVKNYFTMAYRRGTCNGFKLLCLVCPFVEYCIEANPHEKHETIEIIMCNSCSNFIVTGDKEITWRYFSKGKWPFDWCPCLFNKYDKTTESCDHREKYPKYRNIDTYMETCGLHQIVPEQPVMPGMLELLTPPEYPQTRWIRSKSLKINETAVEHAVSEPSTQTKQNLENDDFGKI